MKTRAFSFITLLCSVGAFSVQAETVGEALQKCRNTDNSLKRLVCYDRVAKSLDQYSGINENVEAIRPLSVIQQQKPAPSQVAKATPPPVANSSSDPKSEFGLENRKKPTNQLDSLAVTVSDMSTNLRGKRVVTFSDGSVWQQTDDSLLKIKIGQAVTIERGVLGAFFLSVEGLNRRMKVKRLK